VQNWIGVAAARHISGIQQPCAEVRLFGLPPQFGAKAAEMQKDIPAYGAGASGEFRDDEEGIGVRGFGVYQCRTVHIDVGNRNRSDLRAVEVVERLRDSVGAMKNTVIINRDDNRAAG
jgi:hypothetical protein